MRMYEWIRETIENKPGLTQSGLANRMGLNPSAINRMLRGNRNIMASEVPVIEEYLGERFVGEGANIPVQPANGAGGFGDQTPQTSPFTPPTNEQNDLVPVYSYKGHSLKAGLNLADSEITDWVARHPNQRGIKGAYAIYVFSSSMEPRYLPGELVYIHPGRPPETGKDCLVEMENGDAYIIRYLGQSENKLRFEQIHPPMKMSQNKTDIKGLYAVVGRG